MTGTPRVAFVTATTVLVVVSAVVLLQGAVAAPSLDGDRVGEVADERATVAVQTGVSLASGGEYWRGVDLRFDGSKIVEDPSGASPAERTFAVWRVSADGKLEERITRFSIDDDGEAELRTAGFRGRVVVLHDDRSVYVRDGVGYLSSTPGGPPVTVENSSWRVTAQTLRVSWSDRTPYEGQVTELEIESNRAAYTVAVTSEDLSPGAIERLFRDAGVDVRRDGDAVLLEAGNRTTVPVNVTGVGPGEYFFEFDVVDTTASAASLATVQAPSSPRIVDVERVERTGDYLEATVACEHCYLVVGGPGQGLLDVVELDDRNDDGRVTVGVNTRYAGLRQSAVPSSAEVYRAGGPDAAERFSPSDRVAPPDVNTHYGLGRVRSEVGLDPGGRRSPIPTGRFDLTLASSEYVSIHGGYSILDEAHVQSVTLIEPSLDGITASVLPNDVPSSPAVATVDGRDSPVDEVAVGDRLVLRIDVTGVFGTVVGTNDDAARAVLDDEADGIDLTLSGPDRRYRLGSISSLLVDEDRDRLYVVIDTGALRVDRPIEEPLPLRATFALDGDAYPYLPAGEVSRTATTVSLVERTATIERLATDGRRIRAAGQSSLAPGSLVSVRVAADEPYSWSASTGVVVDADGSWAGAVDVRDAPGHEFSVGVHDSHRKLAGPETITIGESGDATPTPFPTETPTASPTEGTATPDATTPSSETTTAPRSPSATTTPASPGTTAAPPTAVRTTTEGASGSPTPDRPGIPVDAGIPFAPDLPRLPTPVALVVVIALLGGVGAAAVVSRRP